MGVMVEAGIVKEGTPICIIRKKEKDEDIEVGIFFTHFWVLLLSGCLFRGDKYEIIFIYDIFNVVEKI